MGIESSERFPGRPVMFAEHFDRFSGRERVTHQRDATSEPHVGETVCETRLHCGFVTPAHRRRHARRWWREVDLKNIEHFSNETLGRPVGQRDASTGILATRSNSAAMTLGCG